MVYGCLQLLRALVNAINKLLLIKLTVDISDNSSLLDSLRKAKIFPNFSAGNCFFLTDFVLAKCFLAWQKPIQASSIFPSYRMKIRVFDKSLICNCYIAI